MFQNSSVMSKINPKESFLEQTKVAREERAFEKKRELAAIRIQCNVRKWLTRRKFVNSILEDFDRNIPDGDCVKHTSANWLYTQAKRLLLVFKQSRDKERFACLCKLLVTSVESDSLRISYIGLALSSKEQVHPWMQHMNSVLWQCCEYLRVLKPEFSADLKLIVLHLHVLVTFTSTANWAVLHQKSVEVLRPGLTQLCASLIGHLMHNGFYTVLKDLLIKGLCRTKAVLKHGSLMAIVNLALRPLVAADFSEKFLTMFVINVLAVPALIHHLEMITPDSINLMVKHELLTKTVIMLGSSQQSMRIIFNTLEGSYALCLLSNLIHLGYIEREDRLKSLAYPHFTNVIVGILSNCQSYVVNKQSNLTHWHPILGWFAQSTDEALLSAMAHVKRQLELLWHRHMIRVFFGDALQLMLVKNGTSSSTSSSAACISTDDDLVINGSAAVSREAPHQPARISPSAAVMLSGTTTTNFFRRVLQDARLKSSQSNCYNPNVAINGRNQPISIKSLDAPEIQRILAVSSMLYTGLTTLTQLRLDMLTGLCYQTGILYDLWLFLSSFGLRTFLDSLAAHPNCDSLQFHMLQLFCECMTHYVTILDDVEMYEQQSPFSLSDFSALGNFLNVFLYKSILAGMFDVRTLQTPAGSLCHAMHTLLILLYRRDSRRSYTPAHHWLAKDVKAAVLLADLERGRKSAQTLIQCMPHIVAHADRVRLFRRYVANEKQVLGLTESACASPHSTLITVHRSRIVEDGYRQLALLPAQALKAVIRVRFVNAQGLDEAGIDQDGVFKEFLEESLKRVFNPALNLFRVTANTEQRLYPSPTSSVQENHLQLFEFVGRLLGKAVYEGIVVDVPFATFFLGQIAAQHHHNGGGGGQTPHYSCVDELPSLDPDLYRSLSYVKHYSGDVADLDLTFSLDEDTMGRIVTHELVPGGRAIAVTNDNKINYIHLMAHFRMHVQIKDQTAAFIRGFRSIINPDWLALFSTPELQRLISGDNVPLDMKDLRKHTQYYGGFHDSHRVVSWLWDVLEKDFSENERAMFLKFVTSCSKPPLLGFAHLEPPFSIRCVEVGDDDDTGDTIGSVFRGFFTIRKNKDPQNRLPTSSTCFNLLKLPNYQRKSILREKLRYAVSCNTGFELS